VDLNDLESIDIHLSPDGGEGQAGETEWLARVHWRVTPEGVVPVGMTLLNTAGLPITAEQWRRVKPATVLRASHDLVEAMALLGSLFPEQADRDAAAHLLDVVTTTNERSGYGEDHYRAVALVYSRAVKAGDKAPVQAVRRHFRKGYPDLKESTVKGWIRTAKARGLITETARRRRAPDRKGGDGS